MGQGWHFSQTESRIQPWSPWLQAPCPARHGPQDCPGLGQGEPSAKGQDCIPSFSTHHQPPGQSGLGQGQALLQPRVRPQLSPPKPVTYCPSNWLTALEMPPSAAQSSWAGASLGLPQNSRMSENRKEKRRLWSVWWTEEKLGGGGVGEELVSRPMDRCPRPVLS